MTRAEINHAMRRTDAPSPIGPAQDHPPPADARAAAPLIITGMHRSGTSVTAALLQTAGLDVGQRLMPPDSGNVRGYYENLDFVAFHEQTLANQGLPASGLTCEPVSMPDPSAAANLVAANGCETGWGFKDPRTTLFLDFWIRVFPDARFLFVFRSPTEVIDSLFRRGTERELFDQPDLAARAWHRYNRAIMAFLDRHPRRCALVELEQVANDPAGTLNRINTALRLRTAVPDRNVFIKELLTRRPANDARSILLARYFPEIADLYARMRANAGLPPRNMQETGKTRSVGRDEFLDEWLTTRAIERSNEHAESWLRQRPSKTLPRLYARVDALRGEIDAVTDRAGNLTDALAAQTARADALEHDLAAAQREAAESQRQRDLVVLLAGQLADGAPWTRLAIQNAVDTALVGGSHGAEPGLNGDSADVYFAAITQTLAVLRRTQTCVLRSDSWRWSGPWRVVKGFFRSTRLDANAIVPPVVASATVAPLSPAAASVASARTFHGPCPAGIYALTAMDDPADLAGGDLYVCDIVSGETVGHIRWSAPPTRGKNILFELPCAASGIVLGPRPEARRAAGSAPPRLALRRLAGWEALASRLAGRKVPRCALP